MVRQEEEETEEEEEEEEEGKKWLQLTNRLFKMLDV